MRIGGKVSLGLLGMAGLFGAVGLLANATNDAIRNEVARIRASSIRELLGANDLVVALERTQRAAQEVVSEAWHARADGMPLDRPTQGFVRATRAIDAALERAEQELAAGRRATEAALALAEQMGDAATAAAERRELTDWLDRMEDDLHVHRTALDELVRLARVDASAAGRFLEERIEPHYLEALAPVIEAYRQDADRELEEGLDSLEGSASRADRRAVAALGLALLLAVGIALWTARSIARPIAALRDAARKIGGGDLDTRVPERSSDEIGSLSVAFNQMVERLRTTTVSKSWVDDIIRSMGEILIVTDADGRIRTANRAAVDQLGWAEDELVGRSFSELLRGTEATGGLELAARSGAMVPVVCTPTDLFDSSGRPQGRVWVARDVSAERAAEEKLRGSLAEKEVLLREIHHRVKNNLQVVCSLLHLQAAESASPDAARLLRESESRVRSMALIHEQLYRSRDLARLDFREHVGGLVRNVLSAAGNAGRPIDVEVAVESAALDLDVAIPCGLILHELLSNALEHAFPDGRSGKVSVGFHVAGTRATLTVADDGVGLPARESEGAARSLGLRLVDALAGQLGGQARFAGGPGTRFELVFDFAPPGAPAAPLPA